jgi:hypothetical protein
MLNKLLQKHLRLPLLTEIVQMDTVIEEELELNLKI